MAEVFAPFPIQRTMCNLTFYMMDGRNFVRTKSSLTRRKVLYSPQFKNTRHHAAVMAKASKIGSFVYNALPAYWRQGWMYRSFTGEAYTMLKAGKKEEDIQQLLMQCYVEPIVNKQPENENFVPLNKKNKRTYRKLDTGYWRRKTLKAARRKARREQTLYHAGILARASKIGSILYRHLSGRDKRRGSYRQLTAWAMQLLKDGWDEAHIISELLPALPGYRSQKCLQPVCPESSGGLLVHPKGQFYFITSLYKRISPAKCLNEYNTHLFKFKIGLKQMGETFQFFPFSPSAAGVRPLA
jgi:hypothetical protein